jgi:hypothetical protein
MYHPKAETIFEQWGAIPDVLREAMTDERVLKTMDTIATDHHLSEDKEQYMERLVRGVFLGILHREDVYKELQAGLNIDNRLALALYGELDKKVFAPFRQDIERAYVLHSTGGVPPVAEETEKQPQVVLKSEGPEVLNLRKGSTAPQVLGQMPPRPLTPVAEKSTMPAAAPKSALAPAVPKPQQKGPMILHKQEELSTVGQEMVGKDYKSTAFGGFGGAFKAPFMKKQKREEPIATVELPYADAVKKDAAPEKGSVPVTKKKWDAPAAKTVHYSALSTKLKKPEVVTTPLRPKPQEEKEDDNDEIVDLSTMTPQ